MLCFYSYRDGRSGAGDAHPLTGRGAAGRASGAPLPDRLGRIGCADAFRSGGPPIRRAISRKR